MLDFERGRNAVGIFRVVFRAAVAEFDLVDQLAR